MSYQNEPLVTIITLSYKKYEYIYDAISSVFIQDYTNIQYIIADDGAPNCPKDDIERYIKSHITDNVKEVIFLTNDHNRGTVRNLNQAVSKARGKYIIHLSADDRFFSSDVVRKIVNIFISRKCDVLGTLRLLCDKDLTPICYLPAKFYQRRIKKMKTAKHQYEAFIAGRSFEMASGAALSYTKSYWNSHHFDESYVLWEDGPFIEKYLREGNIFQYDYSFPAIYYREGGISTSGDPNPLMINDMKTYIRNVYENISNIKRENWFLAKLIENYYVTSRDKMDWRSRIKRYIKYFYLLPFKIYYRKEQEIVYKIESWLLRNGHIR